MHKEVYILGTIPSEDYKIFKNRIFKLSEKVLDQFEPKTLKICLTLKAPPRISIIPFKKKKIAVISLHGKRPTPWN